MRLLFAGLLVVSLFLSLFAVYHIQAGQLEVEENLAKWEQRQQAPSPVPPGPALVPAPGVEPTVPTEETARKIGDLIGKLILPKLNRELPILEGTGDEQLAQGVGHYTGSVMPGESDNTVLAGHRDGVFSGLGELAPGDEVIIETATGTHIYRITEGRIVDRDDRTVIVPHAEATLTLVTCYPFNYIGDAPQRYILTGKLTTGSDG